jgi:AAA domain
MRPAVACAVDLTVWGGWNTWPPPGPGSRVVVDFVRECNPLVLYDSLIEFHPGSEQSSTETRAFMRQFRSLANMGAAVVVLHHTGKAESSKLYRGSSDIKAAVDTAYLLERAEENTPEISKLILKCFKARLALGQNFSMEFRRGSGFLPAEAGKTVREIIQEVLQDHPRSKQTDIIKLCVARGCSKSQVEAALKNGNWQTERGPKNAKLYVLPKPATSTEESET